MLSLPKPEICCSEENQSAYRRILDSVDRYAPESPGRAPRAIFPLAQHGILFWSTCWSTSGYSRSRHGRSERYGHSVSSTTSPERFSLASLFLLVVAPSFHIQVMDLSTGTRPCVPWGAKVRMANQYSLSLSALSGRLTHRRSDGRAPSVRALSVVYTLRESTVLSMSCRSTQ